MSAKITIISEDFSRGEHDWKFEGIYRIGSDYLVHVAIRRNFYVFQSHAKIESWGVGGWNYFASIPPSEWHALLPGASQKTLHGGDREQFLFIGGELLGRYCEAKFDSLSYELRPSERHSDYREAQSDGAVAIGGAA